MATIHDVAKKADVSVTTVSRVLNNRGYISEATRTKVFRVMEELHYQPNEIARSLLRKQSNVIGLIIPNVSHPFFSELANYVENYAYDQGFKLLLCNSQLDPVKEKDYIEMLKRNRVDGIIMGSHTLQVEEYKNLNSPIVTIDRQISNEIPYISSDNYTGGSLAASLLVEKGCMKIAHICGNLELQLLANKRTEAFQSVMKENNVEHLIIQTDMNVFDQMQYEDIMKRLFEEHPDIDGVFATSDIIAAFAVKQCAAAGKRIPNDMKIIGYDDINAARLMTPSITTIKQPIAEIGRKAVDLIMQQMNDEPFEAENILPVTIVERSTT
ncbi:LacI family DNA-binding transcriptional regulator [Paenibacillus harenae]|uniref:LacI family sucrose operon transcriptional repressor n=1 Tax=Paenibacillus harenae TaxID=306543 RepID=A0ABT9U1V8_PAEHA|nr:LacI family DNA-binding transcriptional regulator [Paenibacillus harenae]MDQ0061992.1 LacI family sucrose operon transcriptional repressor [Paenibacillus harenae]MDQ0113614.1 LacI family sucrose operon transcriptional repressor [Paenibacillus harenae]